MLSVTHQQLNNSTPQPHRHNGACVSARLFLTLTAAEPWPETATLYQPLKGKSVFVWHGEPILNRHYNRHGFNVVIYITLVWCFTEDQILLSDCASSLAVQVEFSLCVLSANIPAFVRRHICFCMQASSLNLYNRWLLIFFCCCCWLICLCLVTLLYRPTSGCAVYQCGWLAEQMPNTCHLLVSTHAAAEVHSPSLFCHAVNAIFESRHWGKNYHQ